MFTKLKNKILFVVLFVCLSLPIFAVAGFSATAEPVSAEVTNVTDSKNLAPGMDDEECFSFSDGASVNVSKRKLKFFLYQDNHQFDGRMNAAGEFSAISFTLYRYDGAHNTVSPKYEFLIFSERVWTGLKIRTRVSLLARELDEDPFVDITTAAIYPLPLSEEDITYKSDFTNAKLYDGIWLKYNGNTAYKVLMEGVRLTPTFGDAEPHCNPFEFDRTGERNFMTIDFNVSGITSSYFIKSEYAVSFYDYGLGQIKSNGLSSPARSIYDVVNAIDERGKMESEFGTGEKLAIAQEILDEVRAGNKVRVYYLEDIDGTYFSEKKYADVEVPVVGGTISIDDVATALGKKTLRVQNSYAKGFVSNYDLTEFTTEYLSSVWLRTRAVDGNEHYIDMFLDINQSFGDYFSKFLKIIPNGAELYDYMWNGFVSEYECLAGKDPDNVHGFFGIVWIPHRSGLASFSAATAEIFDIRLKDYGFIKSFHGSLPITQTEHFDLMREYNYTWMDIVWSSVAGVFTDGQAVSDYYFFAAEPRDYVGISYVNPLDPEEDDGVFEEKFDSEVKETSKTAKRVWSLFMMVIVVLGVVYLISYFKEARNK